MVFNSVFLYSFSHNERAHYEAYRIPLSIGKRRLIESGISAYFVFCIL